MLGKVRLGKVRLGKVRLGKVRSLLGAVNYGSAHFLAAQTWNDSKVKQS